jgi:uncharacterized protein (DUF488 family)
VLPLTIFTIGHSTRTFEHFAAALAAAAIDCIADVRRFPRSRRHPHFNIEALAQALPEAGIAYHHFEALGGRRSSAGAAAASHNTLWREKPFRNYADYAETAEFHAALDGLRALAEEKRVAIMCAEAVWWRCHRRIIADYLLAGGAEVVHILDKGKLEPARLTEGAVARPDGTLLYAAEQGRLAL